MKKSIFFGIMLASLTLLSACSKPIPQWTLKKASEFCSEHGGIYQISAEEFYAIPFPYTIHPRVICTDGYSAKIKKGVN